MWSFVRPSDTQAQDEPVTEAAETPIMPEETRLVLGQGNFEDKPTPSKLGTLRPAPPSVDDATLLASLYERTPRGRSWSGRLRRARNLRDWRVRNKLIGIVVIPTLAFVVLVGITLYNLIGMARQASDDVALAEFGREIQSVADELELERDLAAGFIAARDEATAEEYTSQQGALDTAASEYTSVEEDLYAQSSALLREKLDAVRDNLAALGDLRSAVNEGLVTRQAATGEYSTYVTDLLNIEAEIGRQSDVDLAQDAEVLYHLSRTKDLTSQVRGTLYAISLQDAYSLSDYQELNQLIGLRDATLQQFESLADAQQLAVLNESAQDQTGLAIAGLEDVAISGRAASGQPPDIDSTEWLEVSGARIAELGIAESEMLNGIIEEANALSSAATRRIVGLTVGSLAVLLLAVLVWLAIARSIARPLRMLQADAQDVANNRLPFAVERLRTADEGTPITTPPEPLAVTSRDEIGQVARAFHGVHQQAIQLATEQAVLRRNVNTMFVNLARRSQSLVERLLRQIDGLEQREQDPDQLENLFRLDHLATRMRRNDESLLVLAGSETTRRWSEPVPLPEIVLAAVSEIEDFTRVRQDTLATIEVPGHAVSDLVHLLAELLENATRFSPPTAQVRVTARAVRGGSEALIEIEDNGIGLTPDTLANANEQLAVPTAGELLVSRRMGLLVIATLAQRHGIRVSLAEADSGGTIARVWLPRELVNTGIDQASSPDRGRIPGEIISTEDALSSNGSRPTDIGELDVAEDAPVVLPIFESVSAWFARRPPATPTQRRTAVVQAADGAGAEVSNGVEANTSLSSSPITWESPVDERWAAAEAAASPQAGGVTPAGLPRRVPLAHFVPGSADDGEPDSVQAHAPSAEAVEPEQVRGLLSSYYRGVERARESVTQETPTAGVETARKTRTAARERSTETARDDQHRPEAHTAPAETDDRTDTSSMEDR
jgi:methyl-accepting chemotaxis protein